jgi:MYXO-CTERM domain-containing protein
VAAGGCGHEHDLESTLTHELGHLLGLGHSTEPDATMFATGTECETLKRDLSPDDEAGLDHLYRELPPLDDGEESVRDGESDGLVDAKGCAAGAAGEGEPALPAMLILVIGLVLGRRRASPVRRAGVIGAALAMFAFLAAPAAAGELRQLELAELGGRADLVVRGVVVSSRPAAGGVLAIDSEVRVTGCLAGGCPLVVEVRRRGGEQAGRGLWVDGEAELSAGDEVVLYLRARPDGRHRVIGGVQGVLRIARRGGHTYAVRDLRGHRVLTGGAWSSGGLELFELDAVRRSLEP